MRLSLAVVLLLAASLLARPAWAEDRAQARALYEEGMTHYNVGEYRKALDAFKRAYYAKADPAFLYNMAQCHRQLFR